MTFFSAMLLMAAFLIDPMATIFLILIIGGVIYAVFWFDRRAQQAERRADTHERLRGVLSKEEVRKRIHEYCDRKQ